MKKLTRKIRVGVWNIPEAFINHRQVEYRRGTCPNKIDSTEQQLHNQTNVLLRTIDLVLKRLRQLQLSVFDALNRPDSLNNNIQHFIVIPCIAIGMLLKNPLFEYWNIRLLCYLIECLTLKRHGDISTRYCVYHRHIAHILRARAAIKIYRCDMLVLQLQCLRNRISASWIL